MVKSHRYLDTRFSSIYDALLLDYLFLYFSTKQPCISKKSKEKWLKAHKFSKNTSEEILFIKFFLLYHHLRHHQWILIYAAMPVFATSYSFQRWRFCRTTNLRFLVFAADVDECATNNGGCSNTLATCANNDGSFTCTCNTGYAGNGVTCAGI